MHHPTLPRVVDSAWILVVFVVVLLAMHIALIRWWPLSKRAWKQIDYAWLVMGLLGVLGSAGSARQSMAREMYITAVSRVEREARHVEERIAFGHSSAICRTFVRSEVSPPAEEFDRLRRGFEGQCEWFKSAAIQLPRTAFAIGGAISIEDLGLPLPEGGDDWIMPSLRASIQDYDAAVADAQGLLEKSERSGLEFMIVMSGPFLLALAIALRITKVTAELRLDAQSDPKRQM